MKYILIILLFSYNYSFGQDENVKIKKSPLQGFNISGNYRFYGQHRMMNENYALDVSDKDDIEYLKGRSILIGDATQLPELTLNISGNPTSSTTFGTDLVVWNQFTGDNDYYNGLQLGINLYGGFKTEIANFNVRAGGLHWHTMTSFTMKSFAGYNRYSLFERNPWDPQFKKIDIRYSEYIEKGAITRDERWGSQAFQGLILDITELPFGLSANIIYGNAQNTGAAFTEINDNNSTTGNNYVKFYDNRIPNYVYGGRLIKKINSHSFGLNTFNQKAYTDFLALDPIDNHILTTDFSFNFKNISIDGEAGIGKYMDLDAGEMITVKTRFDQKLTKIPFEVHFYRIDKNVVNNNAEFVNTSIKEVTPSSSGDEVRIGANGVLQQSGSALLGIGQMANNRQGINLNTDIKITKDLTIILGNGISKEIENLNNNLTFGHAINGLNFSRFWRWQNFPSSIGTYGRKSVLFRGMFETVDLTDLSDNGDVINDKYFNSIESQLKYRHKILGRDWYVFYLGSYASVQPKFSPITVFNEDAYIRVYTHQLENYYTIHPKLVLTQYLGWQRNIANYATRVDVESKRPLNQESIGMGFGFDYMMAKNTGLYVRHRIFQFEDRSFEFDKFRANESTVEVRIYF